MVVFNKLYPRVKIIFFFKMYESLDLGIKSVNDEVI